MAASDLEILKANQIAEKTEVSYPQDKANSAKKNERNKIDEFQTDTDTGKNLEMSKSPSSKESEEATLQF